MRCISCHHGWTAYPDDVVLVAARPVAPTDAVAASAPDPEPEPGVRIGVTVEREPTVEAVAPVVAVPAVDETATAATTTASDEAAPSGEAGTLYRDDASTRYETVEDGDGARPRRRLKLVTALGAIVAVAAAGGAGYVVTQQEAREPSGTARLVISIPDSPVRQRAADGSEIITTTARVANDGSAPGRVPELKATMRTSDGRVVREWRVSPPAGQIAPRNARNVSIGTAGTDVPPGPLTLDVDMVERGQR